MPRMDLIQILTSRVAKRFRFPRDITRGWRPALMTDPDDSLNDCVAPMEKSI